LGCEVNEVLELDAAEVSFLENISTSKVDVM
jgi:hypothetical protein